MVDRAKPTASLHGLNCLHNLSGTKSFILGSITVQLWTAPTCFLRLVFIRFFFVKVPAFCVLFVDLLPKQRKRIELKGDSVLYLRPTLQRSPLLVQHFAIHPGSEFPRQGLTCTPGY